MPDFHYVFAFCQHAGVSHRKAILRFLLQFDSNELQLFYSLLLKSLIPGSLQLKIFGSQSNNPVGNVSDIIGTSTEICVENFTWKKANGFLHLVEEIFCTFDMAHISTFLNVLLIIVARLLESCMRNIRSASDGKYDCNQSNDHDDDGLTNMELGNSANNHDDDGLTNVEVVNSAINHDDDGLTNVEVGNSANMNDYPKEIHVADHMEVCHIIAFMDYFSFTLVPCIISFHRTPKIAGTLVIKVRMPYN